MSISPQITSDGYININKAFGWTSTDVVRKIKYVTKVKKIGHTGTLDPVAEGVLPICIGQGTRFSEMVLKGDKEYRITVRLGQATDTCDTEGRVIKTAEWSHVTEDGVREALGHFVGDIEQIAPMYSAIKHKGQRLYKLARQGIEVEREARVLKVYRAELMEWAPPEFIVYIHCGKGFYARSFAKDIGERLQSAGHLSALLRTRAGKFSIANSITLDEFLKRAEERDWRELMVPVDFLLSHLGKCVLNPVESDMVMNGRWLNASSITDVQIRNGEDICAYDTRGRLLALLSYDSQRLVWHPRKVISYT